MAMSTKERQRKWQERQKVIGKKRVTVMLDKDAWAVLEQKKANSGESVSSIISRAVVNMDNRVSDNEIVEQNPFGDKKVSDNEITERIVTLIGIVGLSEEEVAERFIDEKIAPPFHGGTWSAETVRALYARSILS